MSKQRKPRKITPQQEKEIVALYTKDKMPIHVLATQHNVSWQTIRRTLNRNDVVLWKSHRKIRPQDHKPIVDSYITKKMSTNHLAKQYSVSVQTICNVLQKCNVEMRNMHDANKKLKLNESLLTWPLQSNEAFYIVGIWVTDGNIFHKSYGTPDVRIELQIKDKDLIQKIKKAFDSGHKIGYRNNHEEKTVAVSIAFNSKIIADDFAQCGVLPNKTGIVKIHDALIYNRHLWRGTIDGDGSLRIIQISKNSFAPYIKLDNGSYDLCEQFLQFVQNICPDYKGKILKTNRPPPRKTIYRVAISGRKAYHIIKHLYTNHTISLDRKQIIADKILNDFKDKYE